MELIQPSTALDWTQVPGLVLTACILVNVYIYLYRCDGSTCWRRFPRRSRTRARKVTWRSESSVYCGQGSAAMCCGGFALSSSDCPNLHIHTYTRHSLNFWQMLPWLSYSKYSLRFIIIFKFTHKTFPLSSNCCNESHKQDVRQSVTRFFNKYNNT